jgi:uncharacterized protein
MMLDIAAQTQWVLLGALVLGACLGAVMQAGHVCTMGAISDVVLFASWTRVRVLALALAVAMAGTQGLAAFGLIDLSNSVYATTRILWLSHLVGGVFFGVGMVLAGGCASKTLLRIGGGSLKALSVWTVMALSAAMTLRGLFSTVRVAWLDTFVWSVPQFDIAYFLGMSPVIGGTSMAIGLAFGALYHRDNRRMKTVLPAVMIGALIVAAWYISGVLGYLPEHPDTLEPAFLATYSKRMETVSFVAPAASWLQYCLLFSDKSQALTIGMMIALGMVLGAGLLACRRKTFVWELFNNPRDWLQHVVGAMLMGFGGVLAMGCSISQGLGGLSILSLASAITVTSIALGAVFTLQVLSWCEG